MRCVGPPYEVLAQHVPVVSTEGYQRVTPMKGARLLHQGVQPARLQDSPAASTWGCRESACWRGAWLVHGGDQPMRSSGPPCEVLARNILVVSTWGYQRGALVRSAGRFHGGVAPERVQCSLPGSTRGCLVRVCLRVAWPVHEGVGPMRVPGPSCMDLGDQPDPWRPGSTREGGPEQSHSIHEGYWCVDCSSPPLPVR